MLKLLNLEHDMEFVNTLQQRVGEAGSAVEETSLKEIKPNKLKNRPKREHIE